ncbi:MAG: Orange carotenoid-binding protein [Chroococcus sp. CMT-3BRIN-NPC107]|jgi:hypothetical protein|nr:Orange carotenoid-binding protein [Chroococcus sp. CMT-3BRIN-NPC107]
MTSAQPEAIKQSVIGFRSLKMEDRLAAMALIYKHIAGQIPANAVNNSAKASGLVTKVGQLSPELQTQALRDMLDAQRQDGDEVALDPNPSKALAELVTGSNETIPIDEYSSLATEDKLAFWYQMGKSAESSLSDITPSSEVTEFIGSLQSLSADDRVAFISKAL